jgi:Epoxide hydrolase N terminus
MTEVEISMACTAVRPFRINVPKEELVDLRRRILATRGPDKETFADRSQGVPLATMQELARYWTTEYDWRTCEAKPGVSGACIYWENKFSYFNAKNHSVPTAVSVFPGEQYQAPRSWTERAYHKLIYYNKVDKGGHFAAWKQPQLFSEELRAAFRSLGSSWPAALIQNWL